MLYTHLLQLTICILFYLNTLLQAGQTHNTRKHREPSIVHRVRSIVDHLGAPGFFSGHTIPKSRRPAAGREPLCVSRAVKPLTAQQRGSACFLIAGRAHKVLTNTPYPRKRDHTRCTVRGLLRILCYCLRVAPPHPGWGVSLCLWCDTGVMWHVGSGHQEVLPKSMSSRWGINQYTGRRYRVPHRRCPPCGYVRALHTWGPRPFHM